MFSLEKKLPCFFAFILDSKTRLKRFFFYHRLQGKGLESPTSYVFSRLKQKESSFSKESSSFQPPRR